MVYDICYGLKWYLNYCSTGNRKTAINSNGSNLRVNQQRDGALTPAFSMPSISNVDLHPANVLNRSKSEKHTPLEDDDDELLQVP